MTNTYALLLIILASSERYDEILIKLPEGKTELEAEDLKNFLSKNFVVLNYKLDKLNPSLCAYRYETIFSIQVAGYKTF